MKRLVFIFISLIVVGFSTGLQAADEEYVYRLKWLFNSSVAGDIYADKYDYFTEAGIKVKVKEGGPGKNGINELELGQSHFAVASADQVIRALDKGADVVVLAQIFQVNPMQWIYRASQSEIKKITDLKGKHIGVTFGGNDESIMNTLFAKGGITQDDVEVTGARFDFTPFLTSKVDVWPVYRNSQGVILEDKLGQEGEKVRFMNPADFGVSFVANSVITSGKMVKEHPEVVDKFVRALTKGWDRAMDPANEVNSLTAIASRDKGNNDIIRKEQLEVTRSLVIKDGEFGTIDESAWKQTEEIMLREGQIKKAVTIENSFKK